jgi:type VI secretion system secreted protein Hcp
MRRSGFKGLVAAGLVATSVASSTSVVSASDMFLKIAGIKGESMDEKHRGEIDVLSWSWGTATGTGKVKRGTIPSQCIQDLQLTKYVDSSTPDLITLGVTGDIAKEATLTVRKSGGKEQQDFLVIKMTDVMVTSYQTGGNALSEAPLMDQLTLHFSSIEGEYKQQRPDGTLGDPIRFRADGTCPNQ